ncbi:hypothetical protein HZA97_00600 [Candidatus Woesearchaeota archaeon]|nr:hypothetical protein [Candidatus Woesearchaeota archaeon]
MIEFRTAKEALDKCDREGSIIPIKEDIEKMKSLFDLSKGDQVAGEKLAKELEKNNILWNNVYSSYYDALHKLADIILRFDNFSSMNHICLFAYLCEKHPELDLSWEFFEKVRTKRNGVHYYGQKIIKDDWTDVEFQMKLYLKILEKTAKDLIKKLELTNAE